MTKDEGALLRALRGLGFYWSTCTQAWERGAGSTKLRVSLIDGLVRVSVVRWLYDRDKPWPYYGGDGARVELYRGPVTQWRDATVVVRDALNKQKGPRAGRIKI